MSSLNNLNYYKRSMNSIQSFDDGMGSTMENGVITCNSFATDNFTATTLNSTSITNTGNITTSTLNATTATIPTLNSTTISNSGTTTTGTLSTNTIQTKLTTDTLNLTGKIINLNGTQSQTKMYISQYNNNSIEVTTNTGIAYVDFHSSNTIGDYDARIQCVGGGVIGEAGSGDLNITANSIELQSPTITCIGTSSTLTAPIINSTTINNTGTTTTGTLASTTINNTGTTTTGTLASTTINNTGTTTTVTLESSTINNTGTTTTGTLASTTINNTGTTTTGTLESSTINNTGNISSDTIDVTTSGSIPALTCSSIQSINTTSSIDVLTTSTGDINIGGTGKIYLHKSGFNGIETGIDTSVSSTPYIDFHSSGNNNGYDATIYCDGGTSTNAEGNLRLKAKEIYLNGNLHFSNFLTNQVSSVKILNNTYQNTNTTPKFVSISATNSTSSVLTAKADTVTPPVVQVAYTTLFNNVGQTIFFIVLPGYYYRVETSAGGTLQNWTEWS